MKVLHLCATDTDGGAARASYRLHTGLRAIGVDSFMLVGRKLSDDYTVYSTAKTKFQKFINYSRPTLDSIPVQIFYKKRDNTVFFPTWVPERINTNPFINSADIVNLHWVSGGFLRPETLLKFKKPIVWRLSDMWAFTGGCHYAGGCINYEQECGYCPQLGSKRRNDVSHWLWRRKKRVYENINLTVVSPSSWLAKCARRSSLFHNVRIEVIHNGLDINKYKPIDKMFARDMLNLPKDKKLILFGAINAINDTRKGYNYLVSALNLYASLPLKDNTEIVVFGSSRPEEAPDFGMSVHYLGHLHDDISLALCYSAADVFAAPSLEDNFPSTVLESLACGTPVVAFNVGGAVDMIEHKKNGYVANALRSDELSRGIDWILKDKRRFEQLSSYARERVISLFSSERQAKRYQDLYETILKRRQ